MAARAGAASPRPAPAVPGRRRSPERPAPAAPRPEARRPRRRAPFVLLSLAVISTLVTAIVVVQVLSSQLSFESQALIQRNHALELQYGQLRLRVAQLSAPERIESEAKRLGLVLPSDVKALYVRLPAQPGLAERDGLPPGSFSLKQILGEHP